MISEFGIALLFFILGFMFVGISIFSSALIRPHRPNPIKNSTYECGEQPIGNAWIRFNFRFYVVALVFLLFDVEVVLLFPWALVFKDLGVFAYIAMVVFFLILIIGLAYDLGKGYLDWDKPSPVIPKLKDLIVSKKDN